MSYPYIEPEPRGPVPTKCPECLDKTYVEELDMFGGICEECHCKYGVPEDEEF